jgi:hypothetical protein
MSVLRDIDTLRSGERWQERLYGMIDDADIFQLYWSPAASASPFVEREWRHALGLARPAFIRPVYWQDPMPSPPDELGDLHFARLSLAAS